VSEPGDDDFDFLDDNDDDTNDSGIESVDDEVDADSEDEPEAGISSTHDAGTDSTPAKLIPNSWRTSKVTFTHARIRDYLTTEYDPSTRRWHDCSLFTQDLNESRQRMVATCIEILRTDIATAYEAYGLIFHARENWVKHLLEIDYGETGSPLSIQVARSLADMFNDGMSFLRSSHGIIDDFTRMWFETGRYIKVARRLVADPN
jgi:hypothetical protein